MSIDICQTKYIPISPLRSPAQNLKINIRHIPVNSSVLLATDKISELANLFSFFLV